MSNVTVDGQPPRLPIVLLMTATITPGPGVRTTRGDPAVRLDDYSQALSFYLGLLGTVIDKIVFVENSNSDISSLKNLAANPDVYFLTFEGRDYPSDYGYGYGEMKLLQYAMDNIEFLREAIVVKVTGRYIVRNLSKILRDMVNSDLACDIRNFKSPWIDMRIMSWNSKGFDACLRNSYLNLRDDLNKVPPEMVLSRIVLSSRGFVRKSFFSIEPIIDGFRGYDGKAWSGKDLKLRFMLRSLLRPVMRILGLYPGFKHDAQ